jgi:peptidoglycan/LPS O-acetylase OafA/YrhL
MIGSLSSLQGSAWLTNSVRIREEIGAEVRTDHCVNIQTEDHKALENVTKPREKSANRIRGLDSLRGFAAVFVMLFHYTTKYNQLFLSKGANDNISNWGALGVHFFFVLSGFVIFMTLERRHNIKAFTVARFFRLFPTYWVCVLFTFLIVNLFKLPGGIASLKSFLLNLTMVPSLFHQPMADTAYWSLQVELTFYVIISVLYLMRKRIPILFSLGLWLVASGINKTVSINRDLHGMLTNVFILNYAPLFIIGIIFYLLYTQRLMLDMDETQKSRMQTPYLLMLIGSLGIYFLYFGPKSFLVIITYCCIFLYACTNNAVIILYKPFVYLGTISYSLYLLHQNIGYVVIISLAGLGVPRLIGTLCAMVISIILASIVTFFVEKPCINYGHALLKRIS